MAQIVAPARNASNCPPEPASWGDFIGSAGKVRGVNVGCPGECYEHSQFEKKFAISQLLVRMNIPHEVLMEKIAKCEVVCANCHRVRTFDRAQHGGYHDVSRERKQPVESFGPPPFEQLNLEF